MVSGHISESEGCFRSHLCCMRQCSTSPVQSSPVQSSPVQHQYRYQDKCATLPCTVHSPLCSATAPISSIVTRLYPSTLNRMSRVRRGKRVRPAATPLVLSATPLAPPTLQHYDAVEEDEHDVDWAAQFEDVEALEVEQKQQSVTRRLARQSPHIKPAAALLDSQLTPAHYEATPSPPLHLHFDYHFLVPAIHSISLPQSTPSPLPQAERVAAYVESMRAALLTALSDRIHRLHLRSVDAGSRAVDLIVSLSASHPPSSPFRVLDLGPESSSPSAVEWRSYWSERSELRRFADGRVLECVMWRAESELEVEEERNMGEASVLLRIVRWVVQRKGHVRDTRNIRFVGWQAHPLLRRRQLLSSRPLLLSSSPSLVSSTSDTASLQSTFTSLSSLLNSLSLPLSFTSISAVQPSFRYTDPFPPLPLSAAVLRLAPSLPVVDVVAEFESSSAWPSSLYAIQQIKTAFVIELATSLHASHSPLLASTTVSYTHLDVLTAEPAAFCFRVHLLHHGELQPLRWMLHHSLRSFALQRGEGGLWAGLVCLAKRWVQCHMWGELVSDYVVELLCAAWWMEAGRGVEEEAVEQKGENDSQYAAAGTGGVSNPLVLLIGWLEWLGGYDFASGPLVVPLPAITAISSSSPLASSSLFDRALAAYKSRQSEASSSKPMPALYIASPVDLTSSVTSPHLTTALVSHLQLTAASSASHLIRLTEHCELAGWMSAFKPDLSRFDVLLHLSVDVLDWETLRTSVGRVRLASESDGTGTQVTHASSGTTVTSKRRRVSTYKRPLDQHEAEAVRPHSVLLGVDMQLEYVRALQQQLGAYADVHADLYGGTVVGLRMKQRQSGSWSVKDSGYRSWGRGAGRRRKVEC